MAQRTAVEDLIIALKKFMHLDGVDHDTIEAAIEFAENRLEMEEEQIKDAFKKGRTQGVNAMNNANYSSLITAEQYYNQTYKTQNTCLIRKNK